MDAISLLFSEMDNALLNESGISPADKLEERITLALCYTYLYLAESEND